MVKSWETPAAQDSIDSARHQGPLFSRIPSSGNGSGYCRYYFANLITITLVGHS